MEVVVPCFSHLYTVAKKIMNKLPDRLSDLFSLNHLIALQSIDSATEYFHMVGNLWFLRMFPHKFGLLKVYELIA